MEWRISFSVAERTLVWSFNHVQMQCYAVMKIILKEFIKVKCNPQNQVLCSYFIKTFLFWKYESNESNFWRADNLRECIKYLLYEFSKCIQEGVLRYYFIPRFNLLSIKLTRAAQTELLQLFDIIIQSDMSILRKCGTLRDIWTEFLQVHHNRINVLRNLNRRNLLNNDECAMQIIQNLDLSFLLHFRIFFSNYGLCQNIVKLSCKTSFKPIALKIFLLEKQIHSIIHTSAPGNKGAYQLCRTANNDTYSFDLSSSKLWCVISLYMKGSVLSTLHYVNKVLSSIPPFAIYLNSRYPMKICSSNEAKQFYVNMFLDSGISMIQRARMAWMFDLYITCEMTNMVPLAIGIELCFHDNCVLPLILSPFTCAYYLQFLCYHDLNQHNNRDRALQELIYIVYDKNRNGNPYVSLNITGHCLLLSGRRDHAREMFLRSFLLTQRTKYHAYNSAIWYLQNCF